MFVVLLQKSSGEWVLSIHIFTYIRMYVATYLHAYVTYVLYVANNRLQMVSIIMYSNIIAMYIRTVLFKSCVALARISITQCSLNKVSHKIYECLGRGQGLTESLKVSLNVASHLSFEMRICLQVCFLVPSFECLPHKDIEGFV